MTTIAGCGLNLTSVSPGDLDAADRLMARWAEIGCTHVEISARRLDINAGGRLNKPAADRMAQMIDRHGMAPVLHASHGLNLMDRARREMHVAAAEASIEFCRITGSASMVIHNLVSQHSTGKLRPVELRLRPRRRLDPAPRPDCRRRIRPAPVALHRTQAALIPVLAHQPVVKRAEIDLIPVLQRTPDRDRLGKRSCAPGSSS